jgi:hypothetical protein
MAHAKCLTCRARVWRDGDAAEQLRHLCPGCGGPLESVGQLTEIVGFRALRTRPRRPRRGGLDVAQLRPVRGDAFDQADWWSGP